jgi:hypothetical protein
MPMRERGMPKNNPRITLGKAPVYTACTARLYERLKKMILNGYHRDARELLDYLFERQLNTSHVHFPIVEIQINRGTHSIRDEGEV